MNQFKKTLPCFIILAALTMTVLWTGQALAHYPWVAPDKYALEEGQTPLIRIGWGHKFPVDGLLKAEGLDEILIVSSSGAKTGLKPLSETEFTTGGKLVGGAYVVAAKRKSSFYTKTTDGRKAQSKKGLDNAVKCSWSIMSGKAVINVGNTKGKVDFVVGHPLEIIPLVNPGQLKVGATLPIRVLLDGQPHKGEILATYSGFSTEKDTFAAAITTDEAGRAAVKITAPGVWLLKTQYEKPYPQPEECDVESYVATLTFEIK